MSIALRRLAERVTPASLRPSLRRALQRFRSTLRRRAAPTLSVVVPVYNVEKYIAECLESILNQTFDDFEVIVVNDGSQDGSASIARRYAHRDPRVKVHDQENAGLGAARNAGSSHARGKFLAFIDSDDTMPEDAFHNLIDSLQRTGSDFAVGSLLRQVGARYVQPQWAREIHTVERPRTSFEDFPEVIADITSTNKMFRKDFWDHHELRFSEGVAYEDYVPVSKAYLLAQAFDVIVPPVYHYRTRIDASSITQQKHQVTDLHERFEAKQRTALVFQELGSPTVTDAWYASSLNYDMPPYYRHAYDADDHYWRTLSMGLRDLYMACSSAARASIFVRHRIPAWLIANDRRNAFETFFQFARNHPHDMPTRIYEGRILADVPDIDFAELGAPVEVYELSERETPLKSRLLKLDWDGSLLVVRGLSYISGVPMPSGLHDLRVLIVNEELDIELNADVTPRRDPEANRWAPTHWHDYEEAGFEAHFNCEELMEFVRHDTPESIWYIRLERTVASVRRIGRFTERAQASGPLRGMVSRDSWVLPRYGVDGLSLMLRRPRAKVVQGHVAGDQVNLRLEVEGAAPPLSLVIGERIEPLGRTGADGCVEADFISDIRPGEVLPLSVRASDDSLIEVAWFIDNEEVVEERGLPGQRVRRGLKGRAQLANVAQTVQIESVSLTQDYAVSVSGQVVGTSPLTFSLVGPRTHTPGLETDSSAAGFEVKLPLKVDPWKLGAAPLPADTYHLRIQAENGYEIAYEVQESLRRQLPLKHPLPSAHLSASLGPGGNLRIDVAPPLALSEVGPRSQRQLLQDVYRPARAMSPLQAVLFVSYSGKSAACNPLAICQELIRRDLDLDLVWSVHDHSTPVPKGSRPVLHGSREWYELMGRARYLVNNSSFGDFFAKSPNQVHIQTWHGSALKRIGHDADSLRVTMPGYLERMDAESAKWDYLISPSRFCSEIFPRAFRYSGEVLEIGYPRNDVLVSPRAKLLREDTRRRLGLRDDQLVILYAPTFRDTAHGRRGYEKVLYLDAEKAAKELGHDIFFLIRGHSNTERSETVSGLNLLDVTRYPDVNDLFLAADVLITDYSSVMFDFNLTDKPTLFLVPDLDEYRGDVRGFYFELEDWAPGPLLNSTEEVIDALKTMQPSDHAAARARFRSQFTPLDDGRASARAVDAIFE